MKPLPTSTSSRFAAASSSTAQSPAMPQLSRLPARLEIPVAVASHLDHKPFVSGAWLAAEAARLAEHDKRLFDCLLAFFQSDHLPDLNQRPLKHLPGEARLTFEGDGQGRCEAVCMLNEQAEVLRIAVCALNRGDELVLTKPEERMKPAVPKRAAASSGGARQYQLQTEYNRQRLMDEGFSSTQLDKIVKTVGGKKTLQAMVEHMSELRKNGFSHEQILKIASNKGAAQALPAVLKHAPELLKNSFSHEQILKIASNNGAAQALPAVLNHTPALLKNNFSHEQIVKIASNGGAAQALPAVLQHVPDLLKNNFSHEQILKIASNDGAAQALPAVLQHTPDLLKNNVSHEHIVKIASNQGTAQALPAVLKHAPDLLNNNFSHAQILKIASNIGAAQALPAVLKHAPELLKNNFSHEQILKIASNNGAAQALPVVLQHTPDLLKNNFSHEQILKIASNNGAAQALPAVLKHAPELLKNNFSHEQILKIASNDGAAQALPAVLQHAPDLLKNGFSHEQIVKIASRHGAKNTLETVVTLPWKGILTNAELIQVAAGSNAGASALAWFLQHRASLEKHSMPKSRIIQLAANGTKARKEAALQQAGAAADSASTSRGKRSAAAPAAPRQKKVKTEPSALAPFPSHFPAPARELEIERLNTVHALHTPVTLYPLIDLTMPQGPDIGVMDLYRVRHADEAALVTGRQTYDAHLEQVFPIRDPAHPAQVHPDYADPDDPKRCARNVNIQDVQLLKNSKKKTPWGSKRLATDMTEKTLWQMLNKHFGNDHPYRKQRGQDMQKMFIEALKRACQQELQACIAGKTPPSVGSVRVVPVSPEQCDSPQEAQALAGQYGAVLTSYERDRQPSLRNGRIVCLFAGARLETEEERAAYFGLLGEELANQAQHDYSAQVRKRGTNKRVDWAPYGGGNMGQYFNSSFDADGRVDQEQCNACFMPVTFELTARDGGKRQETMMAVIQYREIAEGKQIKLDYGDKYRLQPAAAQPLEMDAA